MVDNEPVELHLKNELGIQIVPLVNNCAFMYIFFILMYFF